MTLALTMIIAAAIGILGAVALHRNNQVHGLRRAMLGQILAAAKTDILNGRYDFQWRYDAFDSVSYDRMLYSCKPLVAEAFYSDTSFLRPTQVRVAS